jgi:hypothetical protein
MCWIAPICLIGWHDAELQGSDGLGALILQGFGVASDKVLSRLRHEVEKTLLRRSIGWLTMQLSPPHP